MQSNCIWQRATVTSANQYCRDPAGAHRMSSYFSFQLDADKKWHRISSVNHVGDPMNFSRAKFFQPQDSLRPCPAQSVTIQPSPHPLISLSPPTIPPGIRSLNVLFRPKKYWSFSTAFLQEIRAVLSGWT